MSAKKSKTSFSADAPPTFSHLDNVIFDFAFWFVKGMVRLCASHKTKDKFSYFSKGEKYYELYAITKRSLYLLEVDDTATGYRIIGELPFGRFQKFIPDLEIQAAGATQFTNREFMLLLSDAEAILKKLGKTSKPTHYDQWGYEGYFNRHHYFKTKKANKLTFKQLIINTFGTNRQWINNECVWVRLHYKDGSSVDLCANGERGDKIRIVTPEPGSKPSEKLP